MKNKVLVDFCELAIISKDAGTSAWAAISIITLLSGRPVCIAILLRARLQTSVVVSIPKTES